MSRFVSVLIFATLLSAALSSTLEAAGLTTPVLSAQAASSTQVFLQWSDSDKGLSGYVIERSWTGTGGFTTLATVSGKSASYADNGLESGKTFFYRIQAYKQRTISSYSSVASATTPPADIDTTPPSTPAGLTVSAVDCGQINLNWNASTDSGTGVKGYNVFRNNVFSRQILSPATSTSDTGLTASTSYVYSVSAVDQAGNESPRGGPVTGATPACTDTVSPTAPSALSAVAASCSQINLSWSASSDIGSGVKIYLLYRNAIMIQQVASPSTTTVDSTVSASNSYSYAVSAADAAGNVSGPSNTVIVTAPACPNPPSNPVVTATLIDNNGVFGWSSAVELKGKAASLGSETAFVYASFATFEKWLYTKDDLGNQSHALMPGLSQDKVSNGEYVLTGPNELWFFSSNDLPAFGTLGAPAVARQYALQGAPLPTTANLISTQSFGDQYSGAGGLTKLQSGGLVAVWYRPNPNWTNDPATSYVDVGIAYRSPSGIWNSVLPIRVEGLPNHMHRLSVIQHPRDNGVWVFSKGDSFSRIAAMHLSEGAAGLSLDWVDNNFITTATDGMNGPEAELPYLATATDSATGEILLAYQNAQFQIFTASPFVKGAYVSIARIDPAGRKTFLNLSKYVERVSSLGLSSVNGALWLAYRPIKADLTYADVYVIGYSAAGWSAPTYVTTTANSSLDAIMYCADHAAFAAATPDWKAYLYELKP